VAMFERGVPEVEGAMHMAWHGIVHGMAWHAKGSKCDKMWDWALGFGRTGGLRGAGALQRRAGLFGMAGDRKEGFGHAGRGSMDARIGGLDARRIGGFASRWPGGGEGDLAGMAGAVGEERRERGSGGCHASAPWCP
jgi:hypothetical protein